MPRWVDARKVTFKYGLGEEFIGVLQTLHRLGLDRTEPVTVRGVPVSPRDVVAAAPARPGHHRPPHDRVDVRRAPGHRDGHRRATRARCTCTTWSTTPGRWPSTARSAWCGRPRSTPWSPSSCWPRGTWAGAGVLGPEAFDAVPFLELLAAPTPEGYGSPWGIEERVPS